MLGTLLPEARLVSLGARLGARLVARLWLDNRGEARAKLVDWLDARLGCRLWLVARCWLAARLVRWLAARLVGWRLFD